MDWDLYGHYLPNLWQGLELTLLLTFISVGLGLFLALALRFIEEFHIPWIHALIQAYVFLFRGTPLLVQIFLIYYGSGQFEWIKQSIFWSLLKEPLFCALLALTLNTTAYTTELIRGVIQSIPVGEKEAAIALGMSTWTRFRYILLPRTIKMFLPVYSNEILIVLKSTSLASTITLLELTGMTKQIISETYANLTFFCLAGAIYCMVSMIILMGFRLLERKVSQTHSAFFVL